MNAKPLALDASGLILNVGTITACHDNIHNASSPTPTPPATTQADDTAQILALAQKSSEASSPIEGNGGALTMTDTSETSASIAVNAT